MIHFAAVDFSPIDIFWLCVIAVSLTGIISLWLYVVLTNKGE